LAAALIIAFWGAAAQAGDGKLQPVTIQSAAFKGNLIGVSERQPAAVYLPPSYGVGERRFPVIYFLPNFNTPIWRYTGGSYQGFRLRETANRLIKAGSMQEIIIVIPNVTHGLGGSWYRNSALTGNWEDYVAHDLVAYVDSHFRTIVDARARGIAGHGMGGTGALELALKHPAVFGCVYAMSPALFEDGGLGDFTRGADSQAEGWQRLVAQWSHLDERTASKRFTLYMQSRLLNPSREAQFEGLRVSYLASAAPNVSAPYPHIDFPDPRSDSETERRRVWAEILGDWKAKLTSYLARGPRLCSIAIEYGKQDEFKFIRDGAEYVSGLMRSMNVPNTLNVSDGGHDSTLGWRLENAMLRKLAGVLRSD
jgi:enterochelin esterase-like enzyme